MREFRREIQGKKTYYSQKNNLGIYSYMIYPRRPWGKISFLQLRCKKRRKDIFLNNFNVFCSSFKFFFYIVSLTYKYLQSSPTEFFVSRSNNLAFLCYNHILNESFPRLLRESMFLSFDMAQIYLIHILLSIIYFKISLMFNRRKGLWTKWQIIFPVILWWKDKISSLLKIHFNILVKSR